MKTDAARFKATTRYLSAESAHSLNLRSFAGETGTLFVREGVGIAARGEAFRIDLPLGVRSVGVVRTTLAEVSVVDDVDRAGSGPLAVGAIPFDPTTPSWLTVPDVIAAKSSDGRAWCTFIHPIDEALPASAFDDLDLIGDRAAYRSPHGFDLTSAVSHESWCQTIARAVSQIADGHLDKVVLARAVDVDASGPFVIGEVLARLEALFPSCMVFSMNVRGAADNAPVRFIGASPELLVARKGTIVRAHPLAGTIARSGDPETDARLATELLGSAKDRWEHSLVIDAIDATLRPICHDLDVPATPSILPLRNVAHLATLIVGSLPAVEVATGAAPSALELAAALHPTPAVGGVPTTRAMAVLRDLEPTPRGYYAGPVGWVDAEGNGEWAVGLRSATISGSCARMMAGGGIVADSDPDSELTETQLKLQALLAAVVRP